MNSNTYTTPFIKKFNQNGFFYIYDANTNQIIEVNKPVYDIIDHYEDGNNQKIEEIHKDRYPIPQLKNSIREIENGKKEHNLFSTSRPKMISHEIRKPETVKKIHAHGLEQLLLGLTGNCNLNCSYCDVSGKYSDSSAHQRNMSLDTCKKAVDFFCEKNGNCERPVVSFYGGEPLLKFHLIKEVVQYVKTKHHPDRYGFSLTTNGTIMNKEIVEFFAENNFNIMISLDGPQHIHDRYRVPAKGKSLFKQIMKNLELIREVNNDFFSNKISLMCVLAPPFHLDEIIDFFDTDEIASQLRARATLVDARDTTFLQDFNLEESIKEFSQVYEQLVEILKKNILAKKLEKITIEKATIFSILANLSRRAITRMFDVVPPFGACHLGQRRLYVKSNGDFFACERVGEHYPIGHLDKGFDYEKIAGIYEKLDHVMEDCKDCWATLHCSRCWAHLDNLDEFKGETKEDFCSGQKKRVELAFKAYADLLKKDPDSLKIFKKVKNR